MFAAGGLAATISDARADCTPAAGNNVTANCTGTTLNQGNGAPGTSAGVDGYGSGIETGVTVNVSNGASITGNNNGINVGDVTVNNGTGANVGGATNDGIVAQTGAATVTNSGIIGGYRITGAGISAQTSATVTNNAGATINAGIGIVTLTGDIHVTNSGNIISSNTLAIQSAGSATVTNNASGNISGFAGGIQAQTTANITNLGSITGGGAGAAISGSTGATVINGAGATILGIDGIDALTLGSALNLTNSGLVSAVDSAVNSHGSVMLTNNAGGTIIAQGTAINGTDAVTISNFGSITAVGPSGIGVFTTGAVTVTNNIGAAITGNDNGIQAQISANVANFGTIAGGSIGHGVFAGRGGATVINGAGASITGGDGILVNVVINPTGTLNVTNYGSITGTVRGGIFSGTSLSVANNAGGSITGASIAIGAGGGGSSVYNAGSISGTTAAISFSGTGNTLTLATTSVISGQVWGTGADTLQLAGTGAATFDASQLGSASSLQYQGFGTLNKIGNSAWTLTGTSPYAGAVNVNGGMLVVDGDISAASSLIVNAGGTLAGTGTVGTTAVNGGTLAPGDNGTGLLTVKGTLSLTAASTYLVQTAGTANTAVNITGAATPGGARVNALFGGNFLSKQYTILTAAGGVSGVFGALNTNLPTNFVASLGYDATHAYLNLSPNFGSGLSGNRQAVANALANSFNSNGGIPLVYGALNAAGLTQASGELGTGSQQTTFQAMGQFMGLLTDPFMNRGNVVNGGTSAPGYADEEGASAYAAQKRLGAERDAYAMFTKAPLAKVYDPRWSVWAAGYGGSQSTSGNAVVGSNDTTSSVYGTAVGADYLFSPNTIAGFSLAGGGTSFSVANGGSGRSDLFQAGAYVRHTEGAAYVSAALAYGWQDITTNRTVTVAGIDQLHAEFNANAYSGRVEGGYRFVAPWVGGIGITPYAAGQFTTFDLPAYAESVVSGSPAFALAYGAKDVTDVRSELGIRTDKSFAVTNGVLTLRNRFAWAHDYDPDRSIAATFQALPGASFVVNGAAQASDSALTTASLEMKWMNGWSAAATFEGEFSDVTSSYAGKGVVRYAW